MKIKIDDSNQLLKFACEDLQALQAVILAAEDHPEYANDEELKCVQQA